MKVNDFSGGIDTFRRLKTIKVIPEHVRFIETLPPASPHSSHLQPREWSDREARWVPLDRSAAP